MPLFIVLVVALVFRGSLENGFTNWDDDKLVLESPLVRSLSLENLGEILTSYPMGSQGPVTTLTLAIDFRIGGLDARVFHGTALLIHLANCVLLYFLLGRLGLKRFGSLFAALLFGVHPMHVESVAWISERKDLVSTFFFFGAMLLHQRYIETFSWRLYLGCLIVFFLALASKPMAVTLPVVLLLQDWLAGRRGWSSLVAEKVPFLFLAGAAAVVTWSAQEQAMPDAEPWNDALIAMRGLAFYIGKLVVPVNLCAFYPYPHPIGIGEAEFFLPLIGLVLLAIVLVRATRRTPVPLFGALFFVVTLLPVLKLIPVGNAAAADRYTYIPSIGLFFVAGALVDHLLRRSRRALPPAGPARLTAGRTGNALLLILAALPVAVYGAGAHERCKVWRDAETLWDDVLAQHPHVSMAHYNRGDALFDQGRLDEAFDAFVRTVELDPQNAKGFNNMGRIRWLKEDVAGCEELCRQALAVDADLPEAHLNLSLVFNATRRHGAALAAADFVIERSPDSPDAWYSRGFALFKLGRRTEAIESLDRAVALDPLLARKAAAVRKTFDATLPE